MAPAEPGADLFAIQPTPTSADELLGLSSNHVNATAAAALTHAFPPLTTPWATPQSCTWTYIVDNPGQTAGHGAVAWLDLEPIPGASTLSCYPDGMFSYGFTGTFSPGTCPGGWTTATLYSQPDKTESSATTAVCCSYGYSLDGTHCKRSVQTALAVPLTYNRTANTYKVMSSSTTTLYSATLAVDAISVLFTEEDKKQLGIETESKENHKPLSIGSRIGIAVGVGAFILLCLALGYFIVARRRRAREGLTKARLIRDLRTMQAQNRHGPRSQNDPFSPARSEMSQIESPPPAYDSRKTRLARRAHSSGANGRGSGTEGEIEALEEQKAAIEQRLEELEVVSSDEQRQRPGTNH